VRYPVASNLGLKPTNIMKPWIFSSEHAARVALISLVACIYAGSVLINNHFIFFWAEDEPYRYWFYPPAGLRLLLMMLLGLPAAIGIGVASATIYVSPIVPEITDHARAMVLGFTESLAVYGALLLYGHLTGIRHPWTKLIWKHIPMIAALSSLSAAIFSNMVRIVLELGETSTLKRDVTLNLIGDSLGSIFFLALLILARKSYLAYQKT